MSRELLKHLSLKVMPQIKYRIEILATEGWSILDPEYRKMTRTDCKMKLEELIQGGENPNYLRAVPD